MYVLGQDGVRPCCRDSHVSCTPKPVLCFGVWIHSTLSGGSLKTAGRFFSSTNGGKTVYGIPHRKRNHTFLKILNVVQMFSEGGTNTFFFSDKTLNVDVEPLYFVNVYVVLLGVHPSRVCEACRYLSLSF